MNVQLQDNAALLPEQNRSTYLKRNWSGPRAGLKILKKRKISRHSPDSKANRPDRSLVTTPTTIRRIRDFSSPKYFSSIWNSRNIGNSEARWVTGENGYRPRDWHFIPGRDRHFALFHRSKSTVPLIKSHIQCWPDGVKQECATDQFHLLVSVSRPVFLNRRAAARYRALASITSGRETFSWNLSF